MEGKTTLSTSPQGEASVRASHEQSGDCGSGNAGGRVLKKQLNVTTHADEAAAFELMKRDFLYRTAHSLATSRVNSLLDVKRVVDDLGAAVKQLDDIREALDNASALHAHLQSSIARDLRRALAVAERHNFAPQASTTRAESFAAILERVVDMFMVEMSAEQD